jgi:hypothetical protein
MEIHQLRHAHATEFSGMSIEADRLAPRPRQHRDHPTELLDDKVAGTEIRAPPMGPVSELTGLVLCRLNAIACP